MNIKQLIEFDKENMLEVLQNFPTQIKEALSIARNYQPPKMIRLQNIVVSGLGGSAIAGDLVRSYLHSFRDSSHLMINVNRTYTLPGYVNENTLFIASSYSGNTEETIASLNDAISKTKNIICITTGGKILEIAKKHELPIIVLPAGYQPRCALAYSFFAMLWAIFGTKLVPLKVIDNTETAIKELLETVTEKVNEYQEDSNFALDLAEKFTNKVPVIYSSTDILDSVNVRWRGQIQENAKSLAFGNVLPEMNHNEINSWNKPDEVQKYMQPVFLLDKLYHNRVMLRFDAFGKILEEAGHDVIKLESNCNHLLSRLFELLQLADWTSYYLALIYKLDPTEIPIIMKLKEILSKS